MKSNQLEFKHTTAEVGEVENLHMHNRRLNHLLTLTANTWDSREKVTIIDDNI